MKASLTTVLPLLAPLVTAKTARDFHLEKRFGVKALNHPHPESVGNGTFSQLIDHSNPSLGTFSQRIWWDATYYKPGGPIFVFNPGESEASQMQGYLTNLSMPGLYAQKFEGACILIEHRYWGASVPYKTLNAETLQPLNLPNSIKDMTNFAKTVQLEFCTDCNADKAPWVLVGGSYSGALAAWTQQIEPNVFAAYHASSAVVEAIHDFWWYYSVILEALPKNCTNDLQAAIDHIDTTFASGNEADIKEMKAYFNLQDLNNGDFAHTLAVPIAKWQSDQDSVFEFCDYIETRNGSSKRVYSNGVGVVTALEYYASYINLTSNCGDGGGSCDSYSDTVVWNTPDDLDDTRPWSWMLCNEPFGWWQTGPAGIKETNIVSTQLRPDYYQRRCPLQFPKTNGHVCGSVTGFKETHLNMWTHGWSAQFDKVIFVNGQFDPWKSATVSSDYRPNGPMLSSDDVPVFIVEGGVHTPELWIDKDIPSEWTIVQNCLERMGAWLKDWTPPKST